MEKTIYNFLDTYVGDGINISKGMMVYNPYTFNPSMDYFVNSDSEVWILSIHDNVMRPSPVLINTLKSFFVIDRETSWCYIENWFSDKRKSELVKKIDEDFKYDRLIVSKSLKWKEIIKHS